MKDLEKRKKEYQELKDKLDEIAKKNYGMDDYGGFPSRLKFNSYVEKCQKDLEKLKLLREQIQQLEYELMTPKEREEYDEYRRLSKLKAEGRLEP